MKFKRSFSLKRNIDEAFKVSKSFNKKLISRMLCKAH